MVDKDRDGPLVSMDLKDFILTVGARSPTPGGGSVAALTATLVSSCLHARNLCWEGINFDQSTLSQ